MFAHDREWLKKGRSCYPIVRWRRVGPLVRTAYRKPVGCMIVELLCTPAAGLGGGQAWIQQKKKSSSVDWNWAMERPAFAVVVDGVVGPVVPAGCAEHAAAAYAVEVVEALAGDLQDVVGLGFLRVELGVHL